MSKVKTIQIPELEEAPDINYRVAWEPGETEIVKAYFKRKDPALIAMAINARYHNNRTAHGVRQHYRKLRESGELP